MDPLIRLAKLTQPNASVTAPSKVPALAAPAPDTQPASRAQRDLALWKRWKDSKAPADLSALLQQVNPLIQHEVNKWSGTLARPLLEVEGKRLALMGFESYDPNKGAALGTHITNSLLKMSRLSYANQNVARLPENKMLQFHTYRIGHAELADQHGRPPTVDELADHLGWSIPRVAAFQRDIAHQEMLESGGASEVSQSGGVTSHVEESDHTVDFIHHDLPAQQKLIFEHLTGYGGTAVLSNAAIMKKLKMTQGQYSYQKRLLIDHIDKVTAGRNLS